MMTVRVSGGTEQPYRLSEHATEDAGRETQDGANKSAHAILHYSGEAGRKVAHFFATN
jgi:hypothetical protein